MVNINTYGIPYMGSKKKIIPSIHNALKDIEFDSILDMFTGTTRVAQSFRSSGKVVIANDLSDASQCYGSLFLEHPDPNLLQPYLDQMNNLKGYEGWFTENYHGDTSSDERGDGRFMQYKNTIKVDAARDFIDSLNIDDISKRALIACILFSFSKVDNTTGQQQAYLKEWCDRSYRDILFQIPGVIEGPIGRVYNKDCFDDKWKKADIDVVYLDPPYSKNVWYPSYYHIYDSVAKWDKPETVGKAKRRIDRSSIGKKQGVHDTKVMNNNPWYSSNPEKGFVDLLNTFPTSTFLISYSSDSALSKEDTLNLLSKYGNVTFYSVDHKTNVLGVLGKSTTGNKIITPKGKVNEYLYLVQR